MIVFRALDQSVQKFLIYTLYLCIFKLRSIYIFQKKASTLFTSTLFFQKKASTLIYIIFYISLLVDKRNKYRFFYISLHKYSHALILEGARSQEDKELEVSRGQFDHPKSIHAYMNKILLLIRYAGGYKYYTNPVPTHQIRACVSL